jgi:hypothetical protein
VKKWVILGSEEEWDMEIWVLKKWGKELITESLGPGGTRN